MKKIKTILIMLLIIITLTACSKGKTSLKTLSCDYDLTKQTGFDSSVLNITFKQDNKSYDLVKGTVTFNINYSSHGLSSAEVEEIKKDLEEQFCKEGFFGEGTNKTCKVTSQTKSITLNIELNTEKILEQQEELQKNSEMLDKLKEFVESEYGKDVKCTLN